MIDGKTAIVSSYPSIFKLAMPIMLGSAVQNVIALTDSVFLYHLDEFDFQVIGIVSVFYLIISAVGFGFSRGGQIIIARRYGEGNTKAIKRTLYTLLGFELFLSIILFLVLQFFSADILGLFIDNPDIISRGVTYLIPRSYGIFFSYVGVGLIAYYTGISKPNFIVIDTLFLALVNIVLNYGLIFGNFGFESMGIAGAGWASAFAEMAAFVLFVIFMRFEPNPVIKNIFKIPSIDFAIIKSIYKVSANIVLQTIVGLGSWFIFFGLVENLGGEALAESNLIRIIYLIISIPTWGFSSAMNTITSTLIGQNALDKVVPTTNKVVYLNLAISLAITLPIVFFPEFILYPLFGKEDMSLIIAVQPLLYILLIIIVFFAIGSIYFDSLIGAGATRWGFIVKMVISVVYLIIVKMIVESDTYGLKAAWGIEVAYWVAVLGISGYMFYSGKWKSLIQ